MNHQWIQNIYIFTPIFLRKVIVSLGLSLLLLFVTFTAAWAWPTDSQWLMLVQGGAPINDSENDAVGAGGDVNVVPNDGITPAAYIYNDGSYIYYRLRLDGKPIDSGGGGIFPQFGWGFELDTNQSTNDYEWLIMCDGISNPETISLWENTEQLAIGQPSDVSEILVASYPMVGNHQVSAADTCTNGPNTDGSCDTEDPANYGAEDRDWFLDFRLPYQVFKDATGITDNTLIRYFAGTSKSTNNLTDSGADLVAGATLDEMATDYVTPLGYIPPGTHYNDGTVRYVDNLDGFNDVTMTLAGDTIYLRVDDADLNLNTNPGGTITVLVTNTNNGDQESVVLTATGVQGKYTGSLVSAAEAGGIKAEDGIMEVTGGDVLSVLYIDSIDADFGVTGKTINNYQNQPRYDYLTITTNDTDLGVVKLVEVVRTPAETPAETAIPNNGETVRYSIVVTNYGPNSATNIQLTDRIPTLPLTGIDYISNDAGGSYDSASRTLTMTLASLASGASTTVHYNALITASSGNIDNGVEILSATQTNGTTPLVDANPGNDSSTATVSVGGADLRVTKVVNNASPAEGELITYLVRVVNLGPNTATGIEVEDDLPTGITYNSATTNAGSFDNGTHTWQIGSLAPSAAALLTVTAEVNSSTSGSTITNVANISAVIEPDPDTTNDTAEVDISIGFFDLGLTKTVTDNTLGSGPSDSLAANILDDIDYTITLTNNGPNVAAGIYVNDLIPALVNYNSPYLASQGSYDDSTGIWDVGSLDVASSATLTIPGIIDSTATAETVVNEARITTADGVPISQRDNNLANNSDTASLSVSGTDIAVVKRVALDTATPDYQTVLNTTVGDTILYRIVVTNNGPNDMPDVEMTDVLPDGVSFVSYTTSNGTTYDTGQSATWAWSVGDLDFGESATLTITAKVDTKTSGQVIRNLAMITNETLDDPTPFNNVSYADIAVDGTDLALTKVVDEEYPDIGDLVTYTISVTNNGPNDATTVVVRDLLPPELTYSDVTLSDAGSSDPSSYTSSTGIWAIPEILYNTTITMELEALVVNEDKSLIITNTARVISLDQGDADSSNDSGSANIYISASNLQLSKAVSNATPYEESVITYTVSIKNEGINAMTGIEVEDILPTGVIYNAATSSQGAYSAGLWIVGDLGAVTSLFNSATLEITADVDEDTAGLTITNIAEIVAHNEIDANSSDNIASVDIDPVEPPALPLLTIMKSSGGATNANPGDVITYTVTVLNSGSAGAYFVKLDDDLSEYTAWGVDSYDTGQLYDEPFRLIQLAPDPGSGADSGVTLGTPTFYDATDTEISPGADPDGFDANVKRWVLPMDGVMVPTGKFNLQYQVKIK